MTNHVQITTSPRLPSIQYKNRNEQLLANYLTVCNVDFTYQKRVINEYVQDLFINFELKIANQILFIELVQSPDYALEKKKHYKQHFNSPIIFFIDSAIPTTAFYERLVMIFTQLLPILVIPDKQLFFEC